MGRGGLARQWRHPAARDGFTLMEIVLVIVILAVASAVAVPTFARSFRGAKLRNSTRTVLMAHRSAQSKAVLGQSYLAILFDERKNTVEVVDQGQPGRKRDPMFGSVGGTGRPGGVMGAVVGGGDNLEAEEPSPSPQSMLVRKLEEGVKILSFRGGREIDGIHFVSYYPTGMSEGYEIRIGDGENRSARITVDAVTGRARVRHD